MVEQVREEIAQRRCQLCGQYSHYRQVCTIFNRFCPEALAYADGILSIKLGSHTLGELIKLYDEGKLVKVAAKQSMPLIEDSGVEEHWEGYDACYTEMLAKGFRKVEPL